MKKKESKATKMAKGVLYCVMFALLSIFLLLAFGAESLAGSSLIIIAACVTLYVAFEFISHRFAVDKKRHKELLEALKRNRT